MTNVIPEKFKFYINAFGVKGYAVEFIDNHLIYHDTFCDHPISPDKAITIEQSEADWESFWQELNDLDIWKWKKSYQDLSIMDGTQWGLDFNVDGKSSSIYGSNSYPETYSSFIKALSTLMGGMQFP